MQLEQEDAQEFLHYIIDRAHEELMKLRELLPPAAAVASKQQQDDSAGSSNAGQVAEDEEEWSVVGKKNKSSHMRGSEDVGGSTLLSAIFRGSTKSTVKARGLPNVKPSVTVEAFYVMHLPVNEDKVRSIEDALDTFTHAEIIPDYKAKGHDVPVEAEKSLKISKLPQVTFGPVLKMRPNWLSEDCADRKMGVSYKLVATVIHHGRTAAGEGVEGLGGRRYPGSLLIKVLLNRYHHWRRKVSKPRVQPGRLDAAKAWLIQWEGLMVGGIALAGISTIAVRVYSEERMDDLDR
eukprot:gene7300-7513_t